METKVWRHMNTTLDCAVNCGYKDGTKPKQENSRGVWRRFYLESLTWLPLIVNMSNDKVIILLDTDNAKNQRLSEINHEECREIAQIFTDSSKYQQAVSKRHENNQYLNHYCTKPKKKKDTSSQLTWAKFTEALKKHSLSALQRLKTYLTKIFLMMTFWYQPFAYVDFNFTINSQSNSQKTTTTSAPPTPALNRTKKPKKKHPSKIKITASYPKKNI